MLWIIISVYPGYGTNSGSCFYNSILFTDKMQQSFDESNHLNCIILMSYRIWSLRLSLSDVSNKLQFANHDANTVAHHHGICYVAILKALFSLQK